MARPIEKKNMETTTPSPEQPQEQMEMAYQVHTLAQMLYGHMSTGHPWSAYSNPWATYQQVQPGVPWVHGPETLAGTCAWGAQQGVPNWSSPQFPVMGPLMTPGYGLFPR
jgi:hypothetical protein